MDGVFDLLLGVVGQIKSHSARDSSHMLILVNNLGVTGAWASSHSPSLAQKCQANLKLNLFTYFQIFN